MRILSMIFLGSAIFNLLSWVWLRYFIVASSNRSLFQTTVKIGATVLQPMGATIIVLGICLVISHVFTVRDYKLTEEVDIDLFLPRLGMWVTYMLMVLFVAMGLGAESSKAYMSSELYDIFTTLLSVSPISAIPYVIVTHRLSNTMDSPERTLRRALIILLICILLFCIIIWRGWTDLPQDKAITLGVSGFAMWIILSYSVESRIRSEDIPELLKYQPPIAIQKLSFNVYHFIRTNIIMRNASGFLIGIGFSIYISGWFLRASESKMMDYLVSQTVAGGISGFLLLLIAVLLYLSPALYRLSKAR